MLFNNSFTQCRWQLWYKLMRLDQPIGFLLLLWPTLWALWLASMNIPKLKTLIVFTLGAFFMRATGCVINDYIDRKIDIHVQRTSRRPLTSGLISEKEAKLILSILLLFSFILMLTLKKVTITLAIVALILTFIYPLMKRYTYLPQLVLGITFGWSIPMVFIEITGCVPVICWLLFLANITWTLVYDTQYAMIDRDDDLRIGIKSTAILFGHFDKFIIGLFQLATLILFYVIGYQLEIGKTYYISLVGVAGLFCWQQKLIAKRKREAYFQAFLHNNFVGILIFIGIVLSIY